MKRISKYILMLFMGVTVFASCSLDDGPTDYIDAGENDPLIPTKLEMETMRQGNYSYFRSTFYGNMSVVPELMCDGFNAVSGNGNNFGPVHRLDESFTAGDDDASSIWNNHYTAIQNYNIFIEEMGKYEPEDNKAAAAAEIAIGEAHFFRAVSYLSLVRHYAKAYNAETATTDLGVPLVLVYNQEEKPERASVKKVYDQIFEDLTIASEKLANVSGEADAVDRKEVSIDAVKVMWARYYLDTKQYAKAANECLEIISTGKYYFAGEGETSLTNKYYAMLTEYWLDKGSEPIMQLPATVSENGSGTNSPYTRIDYYAGYGGFYYSPYYIPSQKLLNLYSNYDLRYLCWFDKGGFFSGQYGLSATEVNGSPYSTKYFTHFVKYFGHPDLTADGIPNARQHVKPFMIGEVWLILAEASFKANDMRTAKIALNYIQSARGASTTEATEENIENEWFKETVGEGLRFSCLKRWGKGYNGRAGQSVLVQAGVVLDGQSYTGKSLTADDYHWQLPIPSYEVRVNDNLIQNDKY